MVLLDKDIEGDCTLTLKARKTGGDEGFLILFQANGTSDKHWWNIGGWGNTQSGLEGSDLSSDDKRGPGGGHQQGVQHQDRNKGRFS